MITLDGNKLTFTFPEITAEILRLEKAEADRVAGLLLAQDRAAAFEKLLAENYSSYTVTEEYRRRATAALLALTREKVSATIIQRINSTRAWKVTGPAERVATISFQRTLRIPDDGKTYPLPPGLGEFPLVHVADYAKTVPAEWSRRGGVMMPMYQAEALWIFFQGEYPCAIKIGAGKINAVTGEAFSGGLSRDPQNYVVLPDQPWLDGYCVRKGVIRQFVAMPLGQGYSAEEQLTGKAEHGGLQIQVHPLKARAYFDRVIKPDYPTNLEDMLPMLIPEPTIDMRKAGTFAMMSEACPAFAYDGPVTAAAAGEYDMGLGAGGAMQQEIFEDTWWALNDWDLDVSSRCFVHFCNTAAWKAVTGSKPPQRPISAQLYAAYKLPWFDYYRDDLSAVEGSQKLDALKTVADVYEDLEALELPDNGAVAVENVRPLGDLRKPRVVSEYPD